ncbi:hypothetical protein CDAR_584471 [Caerostris darwini]|uniref:Uncharacterized protein n=1 Tax=Caerostris darwini TaxID=1538125 RepID=A0AAV4P4B8_9ARAC|nr:hypothetical protein CDAR_584471 [Caerostris darwini]
MISNDPYSRAAVRPYNSSPNEPLELSADPVLGLDMVVDTWNRHAPPQISNDPDLSSEDTRNRHPWTAARQVNYVADHAGFRAHVTANDPYFSRAAVRPYNSSPNEPLELSADPVDMVDMDRIWIMYGLGYGGYGPSMNGLGRFHRRQGHRQTSQLRR